MEDRQATTKRFTGRLIIGESITITIEYEYAKLIRHLRDRTIVRIFRSVDRRTGNITFEDERDELAQKLVVMERELEADEFVGQPEAVNLVWSTSGLNEAVNEIISNRVLPDEKETYPDLIAQEAATTMEPVVRANLLYGIGHLLLRSLDDAVLSRFAEAPVKASVYDEGERIPRFGVPRATRQNRAINKPRHPMTSTVYIALSETYDQIAGVVSAGPGIVGLARAIQESNTYTRRHTMIRDAYIDQSVDVPDETIDWIFKPGQTRKTPTNGAVALELAAQKVISGYNPCALSTRTLQQYVARGDKLRGITRKQSAHTIQPM